MNVHVGARGFATTFDRGEWSLRAQGNGRGFTVYTKDQTVVAVVKSVVGGLSNANAAGNARLIVSAPGLRGSHIVALAQTAFRSRQPGETPEDWANRLLKKLDSIERITSSAIELAGGI